MLAKICTYAATLCAAGGGMFLLQGDAALDAAYLTRICRLIVLLAAVAALAGVAKVSLTAASMSTDLAGIWNADLERLVLQSGEGRALAIRLAGLIVLAAMAGVRGFGRVPGVRTGGLGVSALLLAGALAAATSFAWVGHVHTLPSRSLAVAVLCMHLAGAAFWLGALLPLSIVTRDPDLSRVAASVERFGKAAVFVVAGLVAAGLALLWALVGGVNGVWRSPYGGLLVVKMTLVACLLGVAAFNLLRLTPRLRIEDGRALKTLRRSIRLECVLGISILIVTAVLTTLVGPP